MFRTSLLTSVAFATVMFAKGANLAVVEDTEHNPEVPPAGDDLLNGGGGSDTLTSTEGNEPKVEVPAADDDAPVVTAMVSDDYDIDEFEPRTRSEPINFGFRDWPIGGHAMVTAELADRARSAVQNAKLTNGKDNGKQFITRSAVGVKNKAGQLVYPNAKKGDIEVVRIKDKVVEAPAASAETETKV